MELVDAESSESTDLSSSSSSSELIEERDDEDDRFRLWCLFFFELAPPALPPFLADADFFTLAAVADFRLVFFDELRSSDELDDIERPSTDDDSYEVESMVIVLSGSVVFEAAVAAEALAVGFNLLCDLF